MPFYQPIEKGATLSVREATRWAKPASAAAALVSTPSPTLAVDIPAVAATNAGAGAVLALSSSPVDSDITTDDSDEGLSEPESDDVCSLPPSPPATNRIARLPYGISPPHSVSSAASRDSYFTGTFLDDVLPRSTAIRTAFPVVDQSDVWTLALVDEEDERVLYAKGAAGLEALNLRSNLVALLDLADETLACDRVVVVLDKMDADLGPVLHSLLYVGGVVLAPSKNSIHGRPSSKFVLVGIDV